jgi:hypothetical protein
VRPGGALTVEPVLTPSWWTTLNTSLDALAAHSSRAGAALPAATLEGAALTQERITATLRGVFPQLSAAETTVPEWCAVHADLDWSNVTAPQCWILDREDWGRGPRGFDAATLWVASLAYRSSPTGSGANAPPISRAVRAGSARCSCARS